MPSAEKVSRAPAIFISHGAGPFPLLNEDHEPWRKIMQGLAHLLENAKGIILFTAHWETYQPHVSGCDDARLFYDYADMEEVKSFIPKEAYTIRYNGRGDSALATRISEQLRGVGFEPVIDNSRGWDHGVFVPMSILRPSGDIPIVQMSVLKRDNEHQSTNANILLGQAVESFRDEGYVILGSGATAHNFEEAIKVYLSDDRNPKVSAENEQFAEFLRLTASCSDPHRRREKLSMWREAPGSFIAHAPGSSEHLMPFIVVAGSGGHDTGKRINVWELAGEPTAFYVWS
ncbi:hypothetical protein DTO207G8_1502 [Paecilomyces variotii]|nr:hypothetical protein DTO207G8_1502 [Paecilomyces variotii]